MISTASGSKSDMKNARNLIEMISRGERSPLEALRDKQLCVRIARGDTSACLALFRKHESLIERCMENFLDDAPSAEMLEEDLLLVGLVKVASTLCNWRDTGLVPSHPLSHLSKVASDCFQEQFILLCMESRGDSESSEGVSWRPPFFDLGTLVRFDSELCEELFSLCACDCERTVIAGMRENLPWSEIGEKLGASGRIARRVRDQVDNRAVAMGILPPARPRSDSLSEALQRPECSTRTLGE